MKLKILLKIRDIICNESDDTRVNFKSFHPVSGSYLEPRVYTMDTNYCNLRYSTLHTNIQVVKTRISGAVIVNDRLG
jgi:hypothetical protein